MTSASTPAPQPDQDPTTFFGTSPTAVVDQPRLAQPLTALVGGRYLLQKQLGLGGMGSVYQALDRLTGQPVALKQVKTEGEGSPVEPVTIADPRFMLAQEFQALSSLRHPNIVGVLDYGFTKEGYPYFTMDLVPGAQTIVAVGRERPLSFRLELLVQTLQALAYIHRRGFVHRDLKPGNVLVTLNEAGEPTVKVLDFGLSTEFGQEKAPTAGTLAYMAPEMLYDQSASPASDLYALGVIAYELIAGRHPFTEFDDEDPTTQSGQLVQRILTVKPRRRYLKHEPKLADIVLTLLAKQAENRYESPTAVIEALRRATGQQWAVETEATRESFLQAATFVGRQEELYKLGEALNRALEGQGSAWLIGGESGVGKSRLSEELRTLALIQGAAVMRGQAIRDGGSPFLLWQPVLRRLLLVTPVSERAAAILKPIVPDIEELLERPLPDAPELEPRMAQIRLLSTVVELFQQQEQVVVVLLEDLQWAGAESFALLEAVGALAAERPLLIVGNYRDDEMPHLPAQFPQMEQLKLSRLPAADIARLSESILGPAGREPAVLNLLQRETEGNPFFLVEVVRALAEEAGQLEDVAQMTLPAQVFTGGLQRLLNRRLEQIPAEMQGLLQLAAVAGRLVDLPALRVAAEWRGVDIEGWLIICANAAVLDVQDGQWRFVHDKLRENVLANLGAEERTSLHRQVAEAYEAVYGQRPEQAANLAFHWAEAGVPEKEQQHAALAGDWALRSGAYQEAIDFLTRALILLPIADPVSPPQALAANQLARGRLARKLGQAYLAQGSLTAGREYFERALAILERPVPASRIMLFLSLGREFMRQVAHRSWPSFFVGRRAEKRELLLEAAWAYERLSEIYYFANETFMFGNATLRAVNLAEAAGPSPELARSYANLGIATGAVPLHKVAQAYNRRGLETATAVDDPGAKAWVLLLTGVYGAGVAQWARVAEAVGESVALSEALGDRRYWEVGLAVMALAETYQGHYEKSLALFGQAYPSARARGDIQSQTWGILGQLQNLIVLGRLQDEAIKTGQAHGETFIQAMQDLFGQDLGLAEQTYAYGVLALAHWRRGEVERARQMASRAAPLVAGAMPTSFYSLAGYAGAAETLLSMWAQEQAADQPIDAQLQQQTKLACKGLRKFARVFPIGQPRSLLSNGFYHWLNGQRGRAYQLWQQGIAVAQELGLPYELALLHEHCAHYMDDTFEVAGLDRASHNKRAEHILADLGIGSME